MYITHRGTIVTILSQKKDSAGELWYKIRLEDKTEGYVLASTVDPVTAADAAPAPAGSFPFRAVTKVKKVNLNPRSGSSKWTLDEADQLQQLREGLLVDYTTKSFGVSFSLADEAVSFNGKNLKRRIEELKLLLPYLRNVKRVDMENCGIDNEPCGTRSLSPSWSGG